MLSCGQLFGCPLVPSKSSASRATLCSTSHAPLRLLSQRDRHRAVSSVAANEGPGERMQDVCLRKAGALVLSSMLLLGSPAASLAEQFGDLQQQPTASSYTSMAKPLPKQPVDKGRVWTILVGGAVVLFTGTLVLENYESFFPAISKANKAMAMYRKKAEQRERKESQANAQTVQAEKLQQQQVSSSDSAAVEAGLAQARHNVLGQHSSSMQQQRSPPSSSSSPAPPSSFPAQLDSGVQPPGIVPNRSSSEGGSPVSSSTSPPQQQQDEEVSSSPEGGPQGKGGSSASSSSSSSKHPYLSNEEINAARSMRMQTLEQPEVKYGLGAHGVAGAVGSDAAALQPEEPAGGNDSAAAAAAAVALAVGSSASKTARLESFVGGVMKEGNQAGFLSAFKRGPCS